MEKLIRKGGVAQNPPPRGFPAIPPTVIITQQAHPNEVDHPSHYNSGKIEAIDVIEDAGFGEGFCVGNAMKYILRARHKGSELEDLKKARWYIDRRISKMERENKTP